MKKTGKQSLTTIACINMATVDLGVPFGKLTAALQKCYDAHFLPVWGYPVKLYNTTVSNPAEWKLIYFDGVDSAAVLGYHDLTKGGQPVAKVLVKTALADNHHVSVSASRELFQMVLDPFANLWAEAPDGTVYAYEVCDPVEEDTFLVDGMPMSNFVYPSWFEPFKHPPGAKFDHLGLLKKPFTMTPGGYATVKKRDLISQLFGSSAKEKRFSKQDRRGRRSEYRYGGQRISGQRIRRPRTRR